MHIIGTIGKYNLADFINVYYKGYWLLAPQSFVNSTDDERAKVCNGAGAKGYGWMVPDNILGERITAAADIHDWMYHEHIDKRVADQLFLRNLIEIIDTGELSDIPRLEIAMKYYQAVSFWGHDAFNAKD